METSDIRYNNFIYWVDQLGRAELAERCKWDGTSYINRMVKGYDNVGTATARKLDKAVGVEKGWHDVPHPDLWASLDEKHSHFLKPYESAADNPMRVIDGEDSEYVEIPFKSICLQATVDGFEVQFDEDVTLKPLFYRRDWLESRGYRAQALVAREISGSSMEPALWEGDKVLINTDSREPKNGRVFWVVIDGNSCTKRLRRKENGIWWATSDNRAHEMSDQPIQNAQQIIGEVVEKTSSNI